jgi:hypothetical protein
MFEFNSIAQVENAPPNAAHHPTPGQQDTLQLQVPSLAQNL